MDFPNTKHFKIAIYSYWYKNKYYLSWIIVFIIVLTEASGSLNTMTIVGLVNKSALGMCLLPKPNDRYIHIILFVLVFVLFFYHVCPEFLFLFLVLKYEGSHYEALAGLELTVTSSCLCLLKCVPPCWTITFFINRINTNSHSWLLLRLHL